MKKSWILGVLAVVVVLVAGGAVKKYLDKLSAGGGAARQAAEVPRIARGTASAAEVNEALRKRAENINRRAPIRVDKNTRLDASEAGDRRFRYHYTVITASAEDKDWKKIWRRFRVVLRNRVCTSEDLRWLLANGVTFDYIYRGKNGKHVGTITVTPGQCGVEG